MDIVIVNTYILPIVYLVLYYNYATFYLVELFYLN